MPRDRQLPKWRFRQTPPRWSWPWRRREVTRVDARRQALALSGQEMLTADALSLRLNVALEFCVADAQQAVHGIVDYRMGLYTAMQILLREEVQARTLDQ